MNKNIREGFMNPKETDPNELAKTVMGWYDFDTNYIDDGGQRRRAEDKNDNTIEWFKEHPVEIKAKAYKIMQTKLPASYKSQLERTFGKVLNEMKLKNIKETIKSIKENASIEAISIAQYTGTRKDAVQSFIDTHKLNAKKLLSYVAKGKMKERMDFVSAIAGKEGNPIQKKIIKMFEVANTKSTSLNEVTVTRIPNFNLESDAYIFMLYLLKNNSGFKKAATDAGMALFSGANVKSVFTSLHNNLKKVITPQIVKAVVEKVNEKRTVIFVDSADIQNGVHTARFAGLLALGVVDSFINDPIDYKLINDLGNAKLKGLADEFSVGRGKIKLGVMMGNKGF
jgi:DNA-binding ferritin-like protein (Dps family)